MAEAVRHDKTARQLRMLSDALDSGRLGPVRRLVNTLAPAEIGIYAVHGLSPDGRMLATIACPRLRIGPCTTAFTRSRYPGGGTRQASNRDALSPK